MIVFHLFGCAKSFSSLIVYDEYWAPVLIFVVFASTEVSNLHAILIAYNRYTAVVPRTVRVV